MKKFLEINQINKWLAISKQYPRDHALFHLAFNTGLRVSDLLSLKRSDLANEHGKVVKVLRVKTKKTKTWLDKPLRDDCRQAVGEYLDSRTDSNPYMFPPRHGASRYGINTRRPMSRMTAHRLYKWYLKHIFDESELAGAATHTPRRSMGKIISQTSGRIEPASKFLGHKNLASTASYIDMDGHEAVANEIVTFIEY